MLHPPLGWTPPRVTVSSTAHQYPCYTRQMADLSTTLRCPLCAVEYVVDSEEACQAHIANCRAFHAEYGPNSRRGGLVDGFSQLATGPAAPPQAAPQGEATTASALHVAYDSCALVALPLVPAHLVAVAGDEQRVAESVNLVAHLIAVLYGAGCEHGASAGDVTDFDEQDLAEVTLGPCLATLGDQAESVQAAVVGSLGCLRDAGAETDTLAAALEERLLRLVDGFRYCNNCGRSSCRLFSCTRCKTVRYCGQGCQRAAWTRHKLVCALPTTQTQTGSSSRSGAATRNPFDD